MRYEYYDAFTLNNSYLEDIVMKKIETLAELKNINDATGVSLGSFDGIHIGHLRLLKELIDDCKAKDLKSLVYTFKNHPRDITNPKKSPNIIITCAEKEIILKEMGVDYYVVLPFDRFHMEIKAEDFLEEILLRDLNMKSMTVGLDCRFGNKAKGDIEFLKSYSDKGLFDLNVICPVKIDGTIVSSTLIREYISKGNIKMAQNLLGRPYKLRGIVIKGKQMGRKLGFPTANLLINSKKALPKPGVYITKTYINDKEYPSVTNVGYNPTFSQDEYNIETHIIDFEEDLYGQKISVQFEDYIRNEVKFNNLDELISKIGEDVDIAKKYHGI